MDSAHAEVAVLSINAAAVRTPSRVRINSKYREFHWQILSQLFQQPILICIFPSIMGGAKVVRSTVWGIGYHGFRKPINVVANKCVHLEVTKKLQVVQTWSATSTDAKNGDATWMRQRIVVKVFQHSQWMAVSLG